MFATILVVGAAFGLAAGVFLGLPAFAIGALVGLAALLALDLVMGLGALEIVLRLVGLAVSLQIAYALGLVARAVFPALRQRPTPRGRREDAGETGGRDR
jgi:hypothetical protein